MTRIDSASPVQTPAYTEPPAFDAVAGPTDTVAADIEVGHDDPLSWYQQLKKGTDEIKAAVKASRPKLEATGQYDTGRGVNYRLEFERPVTRDEAARAMFKDGSIPPQNMREGEWVTDDPDLRVHLEPVGGANGRSTEWELHMPEVDPGAYDKLEPAVDTKLMKSPVIVPAWIPAGTRQVIASGQAPEPGDARFDQVENDFPRPYEQVTVWREGKTMFRYDGATGALEGYREAQSPKMGGINKSMNHYVMDEGRSIDDARKQTAQDLQQYMWDGFLKFAIGSVG